MSKVSMSEIAKLAEQCRLVPELKTRWLKVVDNAIYTEETRMAHIRELRSDEHSGGSRFAFRSSKENFVVAVNSLRQACRSHNVFVPDFKYLDVLHLYAI